MVKVEGFVGYFHHATTCGLPQMCLRTLDLGSGDLEE